MFLNMFHLEQLWYRLWNLLIGGPVKILYCSKITLVPLRCKSAFLFNDSKNFFLSILCSQKCGITRENVFGRDTITDLHAGGEEVCCWIGLLLNRRGFYQPTSYGVTVGNSFSHYFRNVYQWLTLFKTFPLVYYIFLRRKLSLILTN